MQPTDNPTRRPGRPSRLAVLVAALALSQLVASMFSGGGPRAGADNFWGALVDPTPIQPAPYAFAIWGIIFLGALVFAWHQLAPSRRDDPLLRRIRPAAALGFAASTAWMVVAETGPVWPTLPLILVMLGAFLWTFRAAGAALLIGGVSFGAVVLPLSLYAGWLLVAVFANLLVLLAGADAAPAGLSLLDWTIVSLVAASAVGGWVVSTTPGAAGFLAAFIWGLVGIAVANAEMGTWSVVLACVLGGAAVSMAFAAGRRRTVRQLVRTRG